MRNQSSGHVPAGPQAGGGSALSIYGLSERSAGNDEVVASLLREMRLALGLTEHELAVRLRTDVRTIYTLETGRLRALADWAETERVVVALFRLLDADPRPVLRRIIGQTSIPQVGGPPEHLPSRIERTGAPIAPGGADGVEDSTGGHDRRSVMRKKRRGRFGTRGKVLMAVTTPMVALAGVVWVVQTQPPPLNAAIRQLPRPIAAMVQANLNKLTYHLSPSRDGLRWVDVADPRTRKADKLPVGRR